MFFLLFSKSILKSYILYKERTRSPVLQRVFKRELMKELVNSSGKLFFSHSKGPSKEVSRRIEGDKFLKKLWCCVGGSITR